MRVAIAGALSLALLGAGLSARSYLTRDPPARREANALYVQSRNARLRGQGSRQFDLLLQAYRTDPTYTPVFADLARHRIILDNWFVSSQRVMPVVSHLRDRELAQCQYAMLMLPRHGRQRLAVSAGTTAAARECSLLYRASSADFGRRHDATVDEIWKLWRRYPESTGLAEAVLIAVSFADAWGSSGGLGRTMVEAQTDPFVRSTGYSLLYHASMVRHDNVGMAAVDSEAYRWFASQRPEVHWMYFALSSRPGLLPPDSILSEPDAATRWEYLLYAALDAYNNGKLSLSARLWDTTYRTYAAWPDVHREALVYRARTHLKAGEIQLAKSDLLVARAMNGTGLDPATTLEVDHNLFHVYEALDDPTAAIASGARFIRDADAYGRLNNSFTALHDLGWYYWRLHDYERAAPLLQRMLIVIDSIGQYRFYAGEYYERVGEMERATRAYELADSLEHWDGRATARRALLAMQMGDSARAIRLAKSHDSLSEPNYPEFTPLLPTVLASFGRRMEALQAAQAAERVAMQRKQVAAVANLKLQRAELQMAIGRADRALAPAESAAALAYGVANMETALLARAQFASASAALVQSRAPLDTLRKLVTFADSSKTPALALRLNTALGDALAARHDLPGALKAFHAAARMTDSLAKSFDSDAERARFRSSLNDVSGRALAVVLRERPSNTTRLFAQWTGLRKAHGLASRTLRSFLPAVARGEAVLDYVVLDTVVAALLVTHENARVSLLPVRPDSLSLMIRRLRAALTPRVGSAIDARRSRFDYDAARKLYAGLIEPWSADLQQVRTLTIIPDGPLHELPFDALVTVVDHRPHYLVERFVTRIAPSLQLVSQERLVNLTHSVAIAGNAPAADAEVGAMVQQLSGPSGVTVLAGVDATETKLHTDLAGAGLIHFATHGTPNDVEPLFAYLSLSADSRSDGRLHGYEIERMDLANAFVVLSGCDTGSGWIAGGEGVLSLSRAFLRAGASATVATLWPVGPATTDFMRAFYSDLARGVRPSQALRNAKLQAITSRYSSPLYWAPFILVST